MGEVVEIDSTAIAGIEEGPQGARLDDGLDAEFPEGLRKVGKAFVTSYSRRESGPKDCARTLPPTGDKGCAGPTLFGKDARLRWNCEDRNLDGLLPDVE